MRINFIDLIIANGGGIYISVRELRMFIGTMQSSPCNYSDPVSTYLVTRQEKMMGLCI